MSAAAESFVSVRRVAGRWRVCWNAQGERAGDAVRALSAALPAWQALAGNDNTMRALVAPLGLIDGAPEAVAREAVQALRAALPGVFISEKKPGYLWVAGQLGSNQRKSPKCQ